MTGASLEQAVSAAEELEEAAHPYLLLSERAHRRLTVRKVAELATRFSGRERPG